MKTKKATVSEVTAQQVKAHESYNQSAWKKRVDDYLKYSAVKFYMNTDAEAMTRFFVVYSLPEGLRLLNRVSLTGSITSQPFAEIVIDDDGDIYTKTFEDGTGIANTPQNRVIMAELSKKHGTIYSNKL